jgi:hypothetical protein
MINNQQVEEAERIYREAWEEYRFNFDADRKKELEKIMDGAQDLLSRACDTAKEAHEEFDKFKDTLIGYNEYWDFLASKALKNIEKLFGKGT